MMPPTAWPLYDRADDFPPGIAGFLASYPELSWVFLRRHHMGLGRILALMVSFVVIVMGGLAVYLVVYEGGRWPGALLCVTVALWAIAARYQTRGHRLAIRWGDVAGILLLPLLSAVAIQWIHHASRLWVPGVDNLLSQRFDYAVMIGLSVWTIAMLARLAAMLAEAFDHQQTRSILHIDATSAGPVVSWPGTLAERLREKPANSLFVRATLNPSYLRVAVWLGGMHVAQLVANVYSGFTYAGEELAIAWTFIVVLIAAAAILDAGRPAISARSATVFAVILIVGVTIVAYSLDRDFGDPGFGVFLVANYYALFIILFAAAIFLSILTNHIKRLRLLGDTVE